MRREDLLQSQQWAWNFRLECGHEFTGRGNTEQKDFVAARHNDDMDCPHCDMPKTLVFFSARGL